MLFSSCAPVENSASICALNRPNTNRVASGSRTIRIVPTTATRSTEAHNNKNRKRLDAQQKWKTLDADEGKINPIQRAGDAGDEGAGDEGEHLLGGRIET